MREDITSSQVRAARLVAAAADLLQIVLLPVFLPAAVSPAADVIDLVVAVALLRLLGWHWAFLPTFALELVPFLDLVPTWTAAVFIVTRDLGAPPAAPEVTVEPPPAERPRALPGAQSPPDSIGS
jgi:hypothetical protein